MGQPRSRMGVVLGLRRPKMTRSLPRPAAVRKCPSGLQLSLLDAVLREPSDAGWQQSAERIARLPIADRTAIQPHLILRLSRYASNQPKEFGDWWSDSWPFFDLAAQLDVEFGWSKRDRIVHEILPREDAEHFLSLIAWARNVTDIVPDAAAAPGADDIPRVPRTYLYAFYDSGKDLKGLRACRAMVGSAKIWPASDAATDLFSSVWSLRDGRYLTGVLGLLGRIGLILTFVPWRVPPAAQALQWIDSHGAVLVSILIFTCPMWLALWIMLGSARVHALDRTGNLVDMPFGRALWLNLGRAPPFASSGLRPSILARLLASRLLSI
jgi:hypothetical protein